MDKAFLRTKIHSGDRDGIRSLYCGMYADHRGEISVQNVLCELSKP